MRYRLDKEEEATKNMQNCLQHLEKVIATCRRGPEIVAYQTLAVRLGLKYCAILSHAGQYKSYRYSHDSAIEQAEILIGKLTQSLIILA